MLHFILLVADERLEQNDLLLVGSVTDGLSHLQGLVEVAIFVMTLGQVKLVFGDLGIEFGELLVHACRVEEVLAHVVAIGKE